MTEVTPRYLRRERAAQYVRDSWGIPCAPKTLAKLAVVGGGPEYSLAGRIPIYTKAGLDKWAESKIGPPRKSTSGIPSD